MALAIAVVAGLTALVALASNLQLRVRLRRLETRRPESRRRTLGTGTGGGGFEHLGLVRYRAFHDTGGDHSFALALCNAGGAGAVIAGIFHREGCRVYAKPLEAWGSSYQLTDAEAEAVRRARTDDPSVEYESTRQ